VDPTDKNKTTPLHLTAKYGHDKTTAILIENGAKLTQVL
jgi:ankyrin repeat protein